MLVKRIFKCGRYNVSYKCRAFAQVLRAMSVEFRLYKVDMFSRHCFFVFYVYPNIHQSLVEIASSLGLIIVPIKQSFLSDNDIEVYISNYINKLPLSL